MHLCIKTYKVTHNIINMFFQAIGLGVFIYGVVYAAILFLIDSDLELAFYKRFGKPVGHLKGKVVFITGASSGIGEHTALVLAKYGVKLVLAARRKDELERVKRACLEISNGLLNENDILVLQMDMLDIESHQKYFDYAIAHFGNVDILVNNAGRSQRAVWEDIDLIVDKQLFELNVFSVLSLTRIAVKYFNSRGFGHVAVTSSIAGVIGVPYSGSYSGAKFGIHGYFNSLRTEKQNKNIDVTIFCPGPIFTNFLSESFTAKPGEKYGIGTQPTDKRMTAERCGELYAVAIANKLNESWVALSPLVPFTYVAVYFPIIFRCALKVIGPEYLFKLRDSRNTDILSEAVKSK